MKTITGLLMLPLLIVGCMLGLVWGCLRTGFEAGNDLIDARVESAKQSQAARRAR